QPVVKIQCLAGALTAHPGVCEWEKIVRMKVLVYVERPALGIPLCEVDRLLAEKVRRPFVAVLLYAFGVGDQEHARRAVDQRAEIAFILTGSLLGFLAILDVGSGEVPAQDTAVFSQQRSDAHEEPAIVAAFVAEAGLRLPRRAVGKSTGSGGVELFQIIGMS